MSMALDSFTAEVKMKIIYIEWNDAVSLDYWIDTSEIKPELALIISVGMLVMENKEIITIALNHDISNSKHSCIINIPKAWIKVKKVIKTIK